MAGPYPSKYELEDATVYLHEQDDETAQVTHIDVEHPDLNDIIEPGENTYVGGKEGGIFVGLKDEMLERAESYLDSRTDG
jgi:hypothetical protein